MSSQLSNSRNSQQGDVQLIKQTMNKREQKDNKIENKISDDNKNFSIEYELIPSLIAQALDKASDLKIQELTFILIHDTVDRRMIDEILTCLFEKGSNLKKINVIATKIKKVRELQQDIQIILYGSPYRWITYQWSWFELKQGWQEYEKDINEEIDIAYEEYLKDNSKSNFEFTFPISNHPAIPEMVYKTPMQPTNRQQMPFTLINNSSYQAIRPFQSSYQSSVEEQIRDQL